MEVMVTNMYEDNLNNTKFGVEQKLSHIQIIHITNKRKDMQFKYYFTKFTIVLDNQSHIRSEDS